MFFTIYVLNRLKISEIVYSTDYIINRLKYYVVNVDFCKQSSNARMNDDICQIKLELDVFEIAGPDDKGEHFILAN